MLNLVIKNLRLFNLLLLSTVFACTANAGIYKGTDDNGNVYYSDQPIENSEKYTPGPISVVGSGSTKARTKASSTATTTAITTETAKEGEAESYKYTKFDIVDPVQNQVVRNQSELSVSLQIAPPLNIKQNHKIWLLVDGKPVVKDSQVMSLQVGRLDRGAHQFQAQVRDGNGKIVARTRTIAAHFKYGAN